jgi:hypothetical protein
MDQLASQFTLAAMVSFALQWLKAQPWFPWVTVETQKINRATSIALAALSGVGIFVTWNHDAGTLMISGLKAANLWHVGVKVVQQFAMQHVLYKAVIAPPIPGVMQSEGSTRLGLAKPEVDISPEKK